MRRQAHQNKYRNSGLTKAVAHELLSNLERLMKHDKIYRESNLNMWMLVDRLKSNYHFVSQVINQHYQLNFFEYINRMRVHEARHLLISQANLSVIEVAYRVGYSTKNTFNTAFKKYTGYTPTEYRSRFAKHDLEVRPVPTAPLETNGSAW